ncbi:MAG: phosphoribosylglycinamide synthetase, partial [Actinobacteria bacterium]|nr:phosphoribosylglycinamide synthetase [Actinomycetota bacterium]NIS32733.1 phosphoribosylglycinamide synthetase [Actinomycetota bacterium]NIU67710.1 phosphoribosylglycinamide synthetase [Actinomycetota bacterium]NIV88086.1 phosphoribosylglycinamide synthetase [Actinomycetota bacterium]NIW29480.1 phosphoribosylglycinamide synthetase [Actinomycetota bacterium]
PTETYRAPDFVDAASALGVELSVASEQPIPLLSQDRTALIDCARPDWSAERLVDLASSTPVDAIVAADDQGVVLAALASERLGLPHNPPDAAAA